MARPGMFSFRCHTLQGPIGRPYMSLNGSTLPPLPVILKLSSSSSALWSRFKGKPCSSQSQSNLLPSTSRARTARESPVFAQKILFPTIRVDTHVEPLNMVSIPDSDIRLLFVFMNELTSIDFTSVESTTRCYCLARSNTFFISVSTPLLRPCLTYSLTSLPFCPCPSATRKK